MSQCVNCNKDIAEAHQNYCDWDCQIQHAKKNGGREIRPNMLPIACIRFDNAMLEHEYADHPDYKFPVRVKRIDEPTAEDLATLDAFMLAMEFGDETHALIYTDGSVAVTIYECSYTIWHVSTGDCLGGFNDRKKWRITDESLVVLQEMARPLIVSFLKSTGR